VICGRVITWINNWVSQIKNQIWEVQLHPRVVWVANEDLLEDKLKKKNLIWLRLEKLKNQVINLECVWYCGSGCGCGLKKVVL
jgi:hypothetical protein